MAFADHFSKQANAYAAFRPSYPDALGAYLAALNPTGGLSPTQVWDCATGSGQAATMLARHFDRVVATDASAAQIGKADACERVEYSVVPFTAIPAPPFEMTARWSAADLLGFLGTWSAVARCREFEGQDPLVPFAADLTRVWPGGSATLDVRWPLYMRVGRRP